MPCVLRRRADGVFEAPAGKKVQVDVQSAQPATTVRLIYAGEQDGEAPFEFKIKAGRQKLLIVALGVTDDQMMRVVEVSGTTSCPLRKFFWSNTHFHTTLDIEGV
jgi:hypothetical protein